MNEIPCPEFIDNLVSADWDQQVDQDQQIDQYLDDRTDQYE